MRIFYVTDGMHIAGGQLINLEHVAALRRMGFDARLLVIRPPAEEGQEFIPQFPPGLDLPWQRRAPDLTGDDYVVIGEMFAAGALATMETPARKVIHNQNPFYTYQAFLDAPAIRTWGAEAVIAGSRFGAAMLERMGWDGPTWPVRVFVDPAFAQDPLTLRALRVAAMTRKRGLEARLIRGILRSRRPDLAHIPWVEIAGVSRAEAARLVKDCDVFLSLSEKEGLGLPPLEAMSSGALVVGYHGDGGLEYATPANGDWFEDGRHVEIADTLAQRLEALKNGERFEARRLAGAATARAFSPERFEAELRAAWEGIIALR